MKTIAKFAAMCAGSAASFFFAAVPARACGVWHLENSRGERVMTFYVTSAYEGASESRSALAFSVDRDRATVRSRGAYSGAVLEATERSITVARRGKRTPAVRVHGGNVDIGGTRYVLDVRQNSDPRSDFRSKWLVTVTRGNALELRATAMYLCSGGAESPATLAQERLDVFRRVAFYLTWRHLTSATRCDR